MTNKTRLSLSYCEWPEPDRRLWQAAIAEGHILDATGPAAQWAPTSRDNARKAYSYWLKWLSGTMDLMTINDPMERLSPERVRAFVESLEGRVASSTVFAYILDLLRFVKAVAPNRDWSWLYEIKNRLWPKAKPAKEKMSKIRPSSELFDLGITLMEEAEQSTSRDPLVMPQHYRDGLIIALLAARPVRLKNLTAIEIDRHLVHINNGYWLHFDADETKNHKCIEVPVPEFLTSYLDRYCAIHRPILLGNATSNRLWISRFGTPLSTSTIYYHIKSNTERTFGCPINPHLFRDCAATSVAIEDPDHVRIAANILGHHSLATTQRYYDQSRMLAAGRTYQSALGKARGTMRQRTREPYKSRPSAIDKGAP